MYEWPAKHSALTKRPRLSRAALHHHLGRGKVIDILFKGIGWTDIALTLDRVAVGMFFMFSGYHKLFNAERHRALVDELTSLHVAAIRINQWWVPSVEFAAGSAVFIGLLTPLAALGLLAIVLVASVTSGRAADQRLPADRQSGPDRRLARSSPRGPVCVHADNLRLGRRRAVQPRCRDLALDQLAQRWAPLETWGGHPNQTSRLFRTSRWRRMRPVRRLPSDPDPCSGR